MKSKTKIIFLASIGCNLLLVIFVVTMLLKSRSQEKILCEFIYGKAKLDKWVAESLIEGNNKKLEMYIAASIDKDTELTHIAHKLDLTDRYKVWFEVSDEHAMKLLGHKILRDALEKTGASVEDIPLNSEDTRANDSVDIDETGKVNRGFRDVH